MLPIKIFKTQNKNTTHFCGIKITYKLSLELPYTR